MINLYTVGHRENYLHAMRQSLDGRIAKVGKTEDYDGGFVTDNPEDCRRLIDELFADRADQFAIFGLTGIDYLVDSYQKPGEWFRRLLKDAEIIIVEDTVNGMG